MHTYNEVRAHVPQRLRNGTSIYMHTHTYIHTYIHTIRYALTLIDALDTLAVLGNKTEFARAVSLLDRQLRFDVDVAVSVFETNIRVLGGLLSAHMLAVDEQLGLMQGYTVCMRMYAYVCVCARGSECVFMSSRMLLGEHKCVRIPPKVS